MAKLNAINGYVVCVKAVSDVPDTSAGKFIYEKETVPEYEVTDIAGDIPDDVGVTVGDIIIVNSTGTKVVQGESEHYLFKYDNIVGKISKLG